MTLRDPHGADGDVACLQVEAKTPHLPAAAPAGLLSRKITGEVSEAAAAFGSDPKKTYPQLLTGAKPRIFFFLSLGAGLSPAEGSVKPIAGFTFNNVPPPRPTAAADAGAIVPG